MQVDAFTMQVDTFTMLTLCLSLPDLKLYLTDRLLVAMGTLNVHYLTAYIYDSQLRWRNHSLEAIAS